MATYFVITYTATAGANGPLLGSDEEDIVIMQFLVWDAVSRKVVDIEELSVHDYSVVLLAVALEKQLTFSFSDLAVDFLTGV